MSAGIDILFSTHNGARTLPRMLARLRQLKAPRAPWRIVAVDNASTDNTLSLLNEAARELPMEVLTCATPGKLPALQSAARAVRGALVVFTDDDVEPAEGWLCAYEDAANAHPDIGLFGGPILPRPMTPTTKWYDLSRAHHAELFALSDQPDGAVDAGAYIYGPNHMIRAEHIDVLSQISGALGPTFATKQLTSFAMGEDTMIMDTLTQRGVRALYVREAAVSHLVRDFQMELGFMLARAQRHGRGSAIRQIEHAKRRLRRRARVAMSNLIAAGRDQFKANEAEPSTAQAFNALWDKNWALGAAKGALFGPFSR